VAVDQGLAGVTVTAYDSTNAVAGTATTGANGAYTLTATGTGPYRLQFSNLPAGFVPGPHGPDSGTTVQFVPSGGGPYSLGLVKPNEYSVDNPKLVSSLYLYGDAVTGPNNSSPAIVSFPYTAGTQYSDTTTADYSANPAGHALAVPAKLVGSTWGLAFNAQAQTIYAAAYMKKHAGFGPGGTGAIYQMGTTGTAASLYVDLNAVFGAGTAGLNPHDTTNYDTDNFNTSWDAVGKLSLGGMAVSDDGADLFVMNLFDRRLYVIPTSGPLNSSTIKRYDIPVPADATGVTAGNPKGDIRPFAVAYHNGLVYVGLVNSAESTQKTADLHAYVYTFDPTTNTFGASPALEFNLNFPRGSSYGGSDN
jgi:hypothetical protein